MNNSSVQNLDPDESPTKLSRNRQSLLNPESEDGGDKLNLDQALVRVGGFGTFQTLLLFGMAFWKDAGMPLVYMYAYFTLP